MAMAIKTQNIKIFALGALGVGLSGSDRIFIEFARRWSKKSKINIYLWTEGYQMCQKQNLKSKNIIYKTSSMKPWSDLGFVVNYFARIIEGIRLGLSIKLQNKKETILYSASDFWMDTLPCFILKIRYPNIKWVATWYQTAPNPFRGYAEGAREEKYRFKALLYWLSQFPIKPIISKFSDFVLVNNEGERKEFPGLDKKGKTIVVLGAVDVKKIENWKFINKNLPKVYDAVFQGRFHPQKGVVEIIEIWKKVVVKNKNAKLVMIGDGPLMKNVKSKIKDAKLEDNIDLLGYVFDGDKKYQTFSESKIVVHPALYDSGGMASAEAMAFGIPCIGFDLKSYSSYYPKGMIKVKIGDLDEFAKEILNLLSNNKIREKIGKEALEMISKNWSWDLRAREVLEHVKD
mgnify:CR=1 FL=1